MKKNRKKRPLPEVLEAEINANGFVRTGKKYKVTDNAIRKWVKCYEKEGYICNITRKGNRCKYPRPSPEELEKLIMDLGFTGVAKKYEIHSESVRYWVKAYQKQGYQFNF